MKYILAGKPTHFRPNDDRRTACGLVGHYLMAYDGRDVDCLKCLRTKEWKEYMGNYLKPRTTRSEA